MPHPASIDPSNVRYFHPTILNPTTRPRSDMLGEQMSELGRAAERRLAELKGRQQTLERTLYSIDEKTAATAAAEAAELEVEDAGAGSGGVTGREGALGLEQAVREAYLRYKQVREKAAAAGGAEQRARAGLEHVAEILGVLHVSLFY